MLEKRFAAVPVQVFTANGGANGSVSIADTSLFKVKQRVIVTATGQPNQELEVKRITSTTAMILGPITGAINTFTDLSTYTTAAFANVFANEQRRPTITADDFERAVYEEEPTVAKRVILVDELGNKYDDDNPFPTSATFSGSISVGSVDQGEPNTDDKAWPVKIVYDSDTAGLSIQHGEISEVASGSENTILTVTPSVQGQRVFKVEVSGDQVALYRVKINGSTIINKRSWWTAFNQTFDFESFTNGLFLTSSDIMTVTVIHNRPGAGVFEATVLSI